MNENRLKDWAAARGYRLVISGAGILEEVRQKLDERKTAGMIDAGLFNRYLGSFRYLDGSTIVGPKRLVMVAVPRPIHVLPLTLGGRKIDGLIPPTYVSYQGTFTAVLADLKENALGRDVQIETLKAPLKSLAVHMGLVVYGRNNITYAPGLGSGHQLCGYIVGMGEPTVEEDDRADGRENMLERCARCRARVRACPTGAIREDRFLISAERCYTLFSESPRPMPSWIRPPKSFCLIGCMICQQVCPENKGRLETSPSGVEFSAEETEAVLEAGRFLTAGDHGGNAMEESSVSLASARAKFETLGMTEDLEVMGRNLGFILRAKKNGRP